MNNSRRIPVTGRDGVLGWVEPEDQPSGAASQDLRIRVKLENGTTILIPADMLITQQDGSYYLPMSRAQFEPTATATGTDHLVIPVIVEEAAVTKRPVETGRVRIHKQVHEREEVIDEAGFREEVDVERVPVNRAVDAPPETRYEGDTLVIPVLEEELVLQKRLVLKEEIRVTRRRTTVRNPQPVKLRSEEVQVEYLEADTDRDLHDPRDPQDLSKDRNL